MFRVFCRRLILAIVLVAAAKLSEVKASTTGSQRLGQSSSAENDEGQSPKGVAALPTHAASNRSQRRLDKLNCAALSVYYKAKILVSTYIAEDCEEADMAYVSERIDFHWGQYVAFNSVFGDIRVQLNGDICHTGEEEDRRRFLDAKDEADVGTSEPDHTSRTFNHWEHRSLGGKKKVKGFWFATGGQCRFCSDDNSDNRRLLRTNDDNDEEKNYLADGGHSANHDSDRQLRKENRGKSKVAAYISSDGLKVPVTLEIDTDKYPRETSFKILDPNGYAVVNYRKFKDAYTTKVLTYDLYAGQTYTIKMKDSYGDGFCCTHGFGGIKIFDGTPDDGMDLIAHFSGAFRNRLTETFTVPQLGVTSRSAGYANPADVLFPDLEQGLSKWITYYIQQEFHNNKDSCLYKTSPTVWVDLERASKSGSQITCE